MTLIEFIGFLITLTAMTFLVFRNAWEQRRKRSHPEEYRSEKDKQEQTLKEFLKSLDVDMKETDEEEPEEEEIEEIEYRPMPPPKPKALPPSPPISIKHYESLVEIPPVQNDKPSRGSLMVNSLKAPRDMVVYQEIMNPPVSMR